MFFKTQEVWKFMYHSNMHFIVTMSNSHKMSWLSLVPKRELFRMHWRKLSLKVNCSLLFVIILKTILMSGSQANYLKFLRDFCLIFWHQDHFQNNNKYGGKNSPSHKNKRYPFSCKTLKNSSKAWKKKFLSEIHNPSHIYQLSLTYFGNFEAYFCSIFYMY